MIKKSKQLRDSPPGSLRTIFLFEAGSEFLADVNNANNWGAVERYSTAQKIIQKFILDKYDKVDSVVVFVPTIPHIGSFWSGLKPKGTWQFTIFGNDNPINKLLPSALEMVTSALPGPRQDGLTARSLIRQKAMNHDARGSYLSSELRMKDGKFTYRMSARVFQDFLAQRINEKQFRYFVGCEKDSHPISGFLDHGYTIQNIRFESGGMDEDDDYVVFEFASDAAARPFR